LDIQGYKHVQVPQPQGEASEKTASDDRLAPNGSARKKNFPCAKKTAMPQYDFPHHL